MTKTFPLHEVAEFIRGVTFKKGESRNEKFDSAVPVLRAGNIVNGRLETDDDLVWVPESKVSKAQLLNPGDVVMAMSSGSPKVVGKSAKLRRSWHGTFGAFLICIRPRGIDPDYLAHWLSSSGFLDWRNLQARGLNIQNLRTSELRKLNLPCPPLSEQRGIATLLDEQLAIVDKMKKEADQRLEAASALPIAYRREIHQRTGDELPIGWKSAPLHELTSISYGIADRLDPSDGPDAGVRILTISNVSKNGHLDTSVERYSRAPANKRETSRLKSGDLLYNWRNGSLSHLGKTAIWRGELPGEVVHVSFLLKLRCDRDRIKPEYLHSYLNNLRENGYYENLARMQVNVKFNASELGNLQIPLPPLPQQDRIMSELDGKLPQAENTVTLTLRELEDIEALSGSLLRQAFEGVTAR